MIRLEKSSKLRRTIRQDDATELGISTWTLVRQALQTRKIDEALRYIDYGYKENKATHDTVCSFVDDALVHLARFSEQEIYELARKTYLPAVTSWLSNKLDVEEFLQINTEFQRGHGGNITVTEELDKYVVRCDPCGSGGQLIRKKQNIGIVKKAYPWTWGKSGVPLYCVHCCVLFEILPTELRGYPIRINLLGERPEDPCIHYFYKKPELIPEEYFSRIGMTKTIKL